MQMQIKLPYNIKDCTPVHICTYTLVCSWKSPVLYPTAKLFWVILDLAVSKDIW